MSTPTMDDAAKVFVDSMAHTDEPKLHAALDHFGSTSVATPTSTPRSATACSSTSPRHWRGWRSSNSFASC
jgi:hypothetical protein